MLVNIFFLNIKIYHFIVMFMGAVCIQLMFYFTSSYIFDSNAADERLLLETSVQHIEICTIYDCSSRFVLFAFLYSC